MHKKVAMSNLDGEFIATIVLTNPNLQASSLRAKRGISLRSKPRATARALTTHTPSQTANYHQNVNFTEPNKENKVFPP